MTDVAGDVNARIVRSPVPDIEIPDLSLTDYVFRTSPVGDDRVAIIDGVTGAVWTRGQLRDRVRRLAGGLLERGVGVGSTVALIASNSPEFAAAFDCKQGDPMVRSGSMRAKIW